LISLDSVIKYELTSSPPATARKALAAFDSTELNDPTTITSFDSWAARSSAAVEIVLAAGPVCFFNQLTISLAVLPA